MDITGFLASIDKSGLARTSSFLVSVTPPAAIGRTANLRDLTYRIDGSSYPSRSVSTIDAQFNNEPVYKVAGTVSFEAVTLSIIVGDDYNESDLFEAWLDLVVGGNYRAGNSTDFRTNYYDDYKGTVAIQIFDANGAKIKQLELVDAYPMQIGYMPLNWEGREVMKMAVTMAYRYQKDLRQ